MYIITRERMSKYTKIVFTNIIEKYEPLLDLLEDISVGIVSGDIRWLKDNRKSNTCELKELLQPSTLFVGWIKNPENKLSWDIPYSNRYTFQNTVKTYAANIAFKIDKDKYNLLMELWADHEKPRDSFKKKLDQNRIELNIHYYNIIKKSDYLSLLDIHSIIT